MPLQKEFSGPRYILLCCPFPVYRKILYHIIIITVTNKYCNSYQSYRHKESMRFRFTMWPLLICTPQFQSINFCLLGACLTCARYLLDKCFAITCIQGKASGKHNKAMVKHSHGIPIFTYLRKPGSAISISNSISNFLLNVSNQGYWASKFISDWIGKWHFQTFVHIPCVDSLQKKSVAVKASDTTPADGHCKAILMLDHCIWQRELPKPQHRAYGNVSETSVDIWLTLEGIITTCKYSPVVV